MRRAYIGVPLLSNIRTCCYEKLPFPLPLLPVLFFMCAKNCSFSSPFIPAVIVPFVRGMGRGDKALSLLYRDVNADQTLSPLAGTKVGMKGHPGTGDQPYYKACRENA